MLKHVLHVVGAVLMWVVFAVYWRIVAQRPLNPETKTAIVSLAILSLFTMIYLGFWVFYNIRISERHGRRKVKRRKRKDPIQDYLGRWIVVDNPRAVRTARYVEVDVRSNIVNERVVEEKVFRTPTQLDGP
jgi:hypothetical protein